MPAPIHVDNWPMENYPFKHPVSGLPVSNFFKMSVLEKDGRTSFHLWEAEVYDPATGEKRKMSGIGQPRSAAVTSGKKMPTGKWDDESFDGMCSGIKGEDLRAAEDKIGGKPTVVQMGLWAMWDGNRWVKTDMGKVKVPQYYLDVTDEYYDDWRKRAYENQFDPFEGMHRPYTKLDEERGVSKAKDAEIERLRAERDRLVAEKNASLDSPVGTPTGKTAETGTRKRGRPRKTDA